MTQNGNNPDGKFKCPLDDIAWRFRSITSWDPLLAFLILNFYFVRISES